MHALNRMKLNALKKTLQAFYAEREEGKNVNKINEIKANKDLAKFYEAHLFDKDLPHADIEALECYRAAAMLGDAEAHYLVANKLIEKARFWDEWANTTLYSNDIHKRYAKAFYEEGYSYLKQAEEVDFPLAIRLHGLAYLRGWGIEKNPNLGIKMIVDSIEKQGSWDKAADIVKELGLEPQKFFSAWTALKNKK